ncbi:BglG family transcription antiterminator [Tessaracoccus caeni]|uniref:BglG family transcription antiterminator n=1 Tax=Tessaracoccus caeni TaxID=3031239 RepID=UPI0023D9A498|nr:PRD domain-containing protein [Tessaracoccus caeni]MDF1489975.1 PRD domain-containing protein [Tessaracoccus caeni]
MSLSARAAQVLGDVLRATTPVRLAEIAARTGVSERTVKTDVNRARTWLENRGFTLSSAGTRGIWVNCTEEERAALLAEVRPTTMEADQRGRRVILCCMLLTATQPLSITGVAEELGVARNTVLHDLADLEAELETFDISFERSRLGLTAVGGRAKRLLALDQVLRANLGYDDLAWLTTLVSDPTKVNLDEVSPGIRLLFERVANPVASAACIGKVTERLTQRFAAPGDIAIGGMLLRLVLVQVVPHPGIQPIVEQNDELRRIIVESVHEFTRKTGVGLDQDDVEFVFQEAALVAAASELHDGQSRNDSVSIAARGLIDRVDALLQAELADDETLLNGLTGHLSDRFAKLRNAIIEPNVIVHEVLTQYADIYRAVEEACRDYLDLSKADLSFLAVHFAAAYERYLNRPRVRTLIVCATGRGVATLIGLLVQSRFPPIEIVRTTSMFEVQQGGVADVDLVISTFPVTVGKPTAVIRSVPTARDFDAIEEKLSQVFQIRSAQVQSAPRSKIDLGSSYPSLITTGLSLNREVIEAAQLPLLGDAAEGLLVHCLLLAERIQADRQYQTVAGDPPFPSGLLDRVRAVFEARGLVITQSELQAIVAYFTYQEES